MTEQSCHDAEFCQQWDIAPERGNPKTTGTVTFGSQCSYPSDWTVTVYTHQGPVSDTSCDVHLAQCARKLKEAHPLDDVEVELFEGADA